MVKDFDRGSSKTRRLSCSMTEQKQARNQKQEI